MNFKNIIEQINRDNVNNKQRILDDTQLYLIYHGELRKQVENIIYSEFKEPKTIIQLKNRICPINFTKKIVDKLGKVYKSNPVRLSAIKDESDDELISMYEKSFNANVQMSYANKMFKLNKHVLVVPYLDEEQVPRLRIIPSHAFSLFSDSKINPEKPTKILIHIKTEGNDDSKKRYELWTKDNFYIIDGNGEIVADEMAAINNLDGINPFEIIPHTHITQQRDLLYPIRSSDIKSVQLIICLLLSDTSLAQKYLSWGTLVVAGGDGEQEVSVGPGCVINLPQTADGKIPDVKYLQPQLNSDEVIRLVEKQLDFLLATNNISMSSLSGQLTAQSSASGVSKMFDQAESTEDIDEQRKYFQDAEKEIWNKFANYMLPNWIKTNQVNSDYVGSFSPEFELSITFPEIKPMLSDAERIANAKSKLDAGFTTLKRAIQEVNPDLNSEEINDLIVEINKEKVESVKFFQRNIQDVSNNQEQIPEENNMEENNGNKTSEA